MPYGISYAITTITTLWHCKQGPVFWFAPLFSAMAWAMASLSTIANAQSFSCRFLWCLEQDIPTFCLLLFSFKWKDLFSSNFEYNWILSNDFFLPSLASAAQETVPPTHPPRSSVTKFSFFQFGKVFGNFCGAYFVFINLLNLSLQKQYVIGHFSIVVNG